ncbi:MAG: hypothetical protein ACRD2E_12605 [Terriglobales bacterium]
MAKYLTAKAKADRRLLIKDSAELLRLAQQLRAAVARTNEGSLSLSVVRKAKRIEKLARKIQKID